MELDSLVQIFGGAGATFYVMWLWLKSVQEEKKDLQEKLESIEEKRINELREMLPLLTDASNGLQEVIKSNLESNTEVVVEIKSYIDDKTTEITEKCKKQ
jgi:NCAIR mutase (PurE)-related protein